MELLFNEIGCGADQREDAVTPTLLPTGRPLASTAAESGLRKGCEFLSGTRSPSSLPSPRLQSQWNRGGIGDSLLTFLTRMALAAAIFLAYSVSLMRLAC